MAFTAAGIPVTPSGIPISKYYPKLSSKNVVFDDEITLTSDIGPYKKGTTLSGENFTNLFSLLLDCVDASNTKIQELNDIINRLKEIIESGGGGVAATHAWPDISNIDGGDSGDSGEDGGKDEVKIVTV